MAREKTPALSRASTKEMPVTLKKDVAVPATNSVGDSEGVCDGSVVGTAIGLSTGGSDGEREGFELGPFDCGTKDCDEDGEYEAESDWVGTKEGFNVGE